MEGKKKNNFDESAVAFSLINICVCFLKAVS